MEGIALTQKGIEQISAKEIKEIIKSDAEIINEITLKFKIKNYKELCHLAYNAQSIERVLLLLDSFPLEKNFFDDTAERIAKSDLSEWISKKKYVIRCIREGLHDFKSVDAESSIGKKVYPILNKKYISSVEFDNPQVILLILIINNCVYFGVDFTGFELNKRYYKIFPNSSSLRPTIAYALARLSGFEDGKILLDPFMGDGAVVIESAFYSAGFSANHYRKEKFIFSGYDFIDGKSEELLSKFDKISKDSKSKIYGFDSLYRNVDSAKKNAKIAGVNSLINFSRVTIDWIDIKFKKKTIDCIATKAPSIKDKKDEKLINDFFYQAEYVLKDDGKVSILALSKEKIIELALKNKLKLNQEIEAYSGKQKLYLLVFVK